MTAKEQAEQNVRDGMNAFREWGGRPSEVPPPDLEILRALALALGMSVIGAIHVGEIGNAGELIDAFLIAAYSVGKAGRE